QLPPVLLYEPSTKTRASTALCGIDDGSLRRNRCSSLAIACWLLGRCGDAPDVRLSRQRRTCAEASRLLLRFFVSCLPSVRRVQSDPGRVCEPGSRRSEERRVGKECRSRWSACD